MCGPMQAIAIVLMATNTAPLYTFQLLGSITEWQPPPVTLVTRHVPGMSPL
jgi:hypothetical protein